MALRLDEYMDIVQTDVLTKVSKNMAIGENVMFRCVDAAPLVPRWRIEMGITYNDSPIIMSTMKMKDPKLVAKALVGFVEEVVMKKEVW